MCESNYALAGAICSECWTPIASWGTTILAGSIVVAAVVFMVRRSTGTRSEVMAIGRIMLNWVQLTSAIGTFALQAPALAQDMLSLSSASDGISLNAFFVQVCCPTTHFLFYTLWCAVRNMLLLCRCCYWWWCCCFVLCCGV